MKGCRLKKKSGAPVPRPTAVVSHSEYLDAVRKHFEHDVIWEVVHGKPSRSSGYQRNASPSGRELFDEFQGSLNLGDKPRRDLGVPLPVPRSSLTKILAGSTLNQQRFQRRSTSARISSSVTRQSVPRSSAASRDRRSISAAHAVSTSCSRSSRLANNSAARLARSSASRAIASSRIFLAASVTAKLYQATAPNFRLPLGEIACSRVSHFVQW